MTGHREIADRFGTPTFVYDLDRVVAARDDLLAALPEQVVLYYAAKANPHPELLRELRSGERGVRAEISSTGELDAVLRAGFPGDEVLYTGPGKTAGELATAIAHGVRLFSVESIGDLRRVGAVALEAGVTADCLLRVNNATGAAATSIRMTGVPSQFGFDSETLADLGPALREAPGVDIAGLHFFPLSNTQDEDSLIAEFQHTITSAARLQDVLGVRFRFVDIGGGFAAPYAVQGHRPVYEHLGKAMSEALDEHFPGWRDGSPRIACESGRYLVADSGTLLTSIVNVKHSRGQRYLVLDAGINTFGGMSGLGRIMPISVEPHEAVADGAGAHLAGPLCTPGDLLGRGVRLPDLEPGELLTVPNAGSYGPTASLLMFLGRPAPTEVVVRGADVISASHIEHSRAYEHGEAL
ncbi:MULTISPECIES: type III PLP-dependent enzyme [Actinosynnema]|uniref:type III PLP-dependent enzyme n=1 Tax=Actinosynnema TaxID=40566 RepID=UPI0020A36A1E|nr:type III PLP-dependent enzyme [Actinosynnema pretiosum]MCP2094320.1 diaminopimelate decarboxylase [Actinosynnema pretiosum]